jgi:hypothetical protein
MLKRLVHGRLASTLLVLAIGLIVRRGTARQSQLRGWGLTDTMGAC